MPTRSTGAGRASRQGRGQAPRQQVREYTTETARAVYDVLRELGAMGHEFELFQKFLLLHDNRAPWHFGKFEFIPTSCQVKVHWRFQKGQPPKNLGEVNQKLAEIRKDTRLMDLKRLGSRMSP